MARYTLVIGNKNYSSWSMRAWLAVRQTGADFDELRVPLFEDGYKARIERYSPAGKVPVLIAGGITIWEALARRYAGARASRGRGVDDRSARGNRIHCRRRAVRESDWRIVNSGIQKCSPRKSECLLLPITNHQSPFTAS